MLKTTGIKGIDYTTDGKFVHYQEEYNYLEHLGHGPGWLYWIPASEEYDEDAMTYTVVIDYFADTALLVVAKTIEYRFTVNDDGTYKMLSTEVLYDSGYSLAGGST